MTTFPYTVEAGKNADPPVDFARVLRTVESLRAMTVERGCTPGEAETAALKIGQAVQRYGLVIKPPAGPPRIGQRSVAIAGVEALAETKRAILVDIDGEEIWIPRSQLCDDNEVRGVGDKGSLVVSQWLAERAGLARGGAHAER